MPSINPEKEALKALDEITDDGPVIMLNMLRFRDHARYPKGSDYPPCSGREAYRRYGVEAIRHVHAVGGKNLWWGAVQLALVGPEDEEWDEVLLVQYPSRAAFLRMASDPDYLACSVHRTAALSDSRLIAMREIVIGRPSR
ncbi:MAG: DUF1330 domain-containing protein [Deltaproteobacteria bacterium]|nr:DUF1330 domain-containing protein [Deltaproteobacteria bacterium]